MVFSFRKRVFATIGSLLLYIAYWPGGRDPFMTYFGSNVDLLVGWLYDACVVTFLSVPKSSLLALFAVCTDRTHVVNRFSVLLIFMSSGT